MTGGGGGTTSPDQVAAGEKLEHLTLVSASAADPVGRRRELIEGSLRFRSFALPWGAHYDLIAEGCPPYGVELRGWATTKATTAEVLRQCPALLIRVPAYLHAVLSGGRLHIRSARGPVAEVILEEDRAAALLGRLQTVPESLKEQWKNELAALGMEGQAAARSISNWRQAIRTQPRSPLGPETRVHAEFASVHGVVMAQKDFIVEGGPIQDVVLGPAR